jgi:hypothetical protein
MNGGRKTKRKKKTKRRAFNKKTFFSDALDNSPHSRGQLSVLIPVRKEGFFSKAFLAADRPERSSLL